MRWANNTQGDGIVSPALHLGMALLIMLTVGLGWYGGGLPGGPEKGDVFYWHKRLGALLLRCWWSGCCGTGCRRCRPVHCGVGKQSWPGPGIICTTC
ncbi:hypothetical protein C7H85_01810 [Zobellella endophytica]|uniref:Cytochrome b561 bacterial/Ni-hydrogenase domain-containing protein n=1 Tax=Zobellella endophytica TaxID=2116700 RepID=A0A2P7RBQ4_9GAMM|nr:hypothetical protein [Zobellella endophytica]PSJ47592.1 hypothetical protein C7H85_01810 [Zobellella endophytica]